MKSPTHAAVPADPAGTGEAPGPAVQPGKVLGIFDLGSNSVRLMLVRVGPVNASCTVLNQVKHMVRLGEGVFLHGRLNEEAMQRTVHVLQGMAGMCSAYGVTDIVACATAAVRDADNAPAFLKRVREHTGLTFTVISGREEARLIYLGVASGLEYSEENRLFIDIGGGSTELIVGDSQSYVNLDSLKLGCVRLTNLFFEDNKGPVSAYTYAALQRYVRNDALHSFQRIAGFEIPEAVASSGTAQNLAEIAAALEQQDAARTGKPTTASKHVLSYDGLRRAVKELCSRTLEERKSVPGINPNRADVIIAGAAILQTIMEEQGFESVTISNRNLQNGILVDYLMRTHPQKAGSRLSAREESVLQLARFCRFEEKHSRHIAKLALELFDSARAIGLHDAPPVSRELLYYAALLHDIGIFISFANHNAHSHYLIRNTELLGFTEREIELIAALAFFHRKRPSKKIPLFLQLDEGIREEVRLLSLFLTLAERMDKSHRQIIRSARFGRTPDGELELCLRASEVCPIEIEEIGRSHKLIKKTFHTHFTLCPCLENGAPIV